MLGCFTTDVVFKGQFIQTIVYVVIVGKKSFGLLRSKVIRHHFGSESFGASFVDVFCDE